MAETLAATAFDTNFVSGEGSIHPSVRGTYGQGPAQVIEEAVDSMLEYEAPFASAAEKGGAAARRGDLLEHGEVVERIERMLSA